MAITFIGRTQAFSNSSSDVNISLSTPAGIAAGDLMLVFYISGEDTTGGGTFNLPAGWTQLGSNIGPDVPDNNLAHFCYRFYQTADGTSYTFGNNKYPKAVMRTYRGVQGFDASLSAFSSSAAAASFTLSALAATKYANEWYVAFFSDDIPTTNVSSTTGDLLNVTADNNDYATLDGDKAIASAGSTPNSEACSGTSGDWDVIAVTLIPNIPSVGGFDFWSVGAETRNQTDSGSKASASAARHAMLEPRAFKAPAIPQPARQTWIEDVPASRQQQEQARIAAQVEAIELYYQSMQRVPPPKLTAHWWNWWDDISDAQQGQQQDHASRLAAIATYAFWYLQNMPPPKLTAHWWNWWNDISTAQSQQQERQSHLAAIVPYALWYLQEMPPPQLTAGLWQFWADIISLRQQVEIQRQATAAAFGTNLTYRPPAQGFDTPALYEYWLKYRPLDWQPNLLTTQSGPLTTDNPPVWQFWVQSAGSRWTAETQRSYVASVAFQSNFTYRPPAQGFDTPELYEYWLKYRASDWQPNQFNTESGTPTSDNPSLWEFWQRYQPPPWQPNLFNTEAGVKISAAQIFDTPASWAFWTYPLHQDWRLLLLNSPSELPTAAPVIPDDPFAWQFWAAKQSREWRPFVFNTPNRDTIPDDPQLWRFWDVRQPRAWQSNQFNTESGAPTSVTPPIWEFWAAKLAQDWKAFVFNTPNRDTVTDNPELWRFWDIRQQYPWQPFPFDTESGPLQPDQPLPWPFWTVRFSYQEWRIIQHLLLWNASRDYQIIIPSLDDPVAFHIWMVNLPPAQRVPLLFAIVSNQGVGIPFIPPPETRIIFPMRLDAKTIPPQHIPSAPIPTIQPLSSTPGPKRIVFQMTLN